MEPERTLWKGPSSQISNLHIYLLCALLAVLVVPIFYAVWRWLKLRSREYEVTTQRIRLREGILNKRTDELELYRVVDNTLTEPFWLRLFGLGNVELTTNDPSTPQLKIAAIPDAAALREELRTHVELCRERKRVRIAELE